MKILLIAYDNGSHVTWFPQGLAHIASSLREAGHEVKIYQQDVYHWPAEHLTNTLNNEHFDVVGVGSCGGYYQYRKLLEIADAINKSEQRPFFMIGGHLVSPEPKYFLERTGADVVVMGEGEDTSVEVLAALASHSDIGSIKGISYRKNGQIVTTEERPLRVDIDSLPMPAWDLFEMNHYSLLSGPRCGPTERALPVLSGRGCPFKCNFCYRMVAGFRPRSASSILEEIRILQERYNISYVLFSDELLMNSVSRTKQLCEAFIASGLTFRWSCNGRLNYAEPELLATMKKAGCVFINYGIESLDPRALKAMKKSLTVDQIIRGVENTLESGISPGLNIIWGNLEETEESLQMGVDFLLKYDDHAQMRTIRPVTPYPGSPLYYHAIATGKLQGIADFYENKHKNSDLLAVNFTNLTDEQFHRALFSANKTLLARHQQAATDRWLKTAQKLYIEGDASFRGFRQT
jgi:radical SAM superfamily enzyme YgiQ (UPF0313 family)